MQLPDQIHIYIDDYLNGYISQENMKILISWINASQENKLLFYKQLSNERKFKAVSNWNEIDKNSDWIKVKDKLYYRRGRKIYRYLGVIAASFIIIISVGGLLRYYNKIENTEKIGEFKGIVTPGKPSAVLTLSTGENIKLGEEENRIITERSETKITVDSANIIKYEARESYSEEIIYNTVFVPKSGEYSLLLSDGSMIWLNSETTIKYPVKFRGKTREVFLSGEAYFDVKSDSSRPFIIHNEKADVKVLGTSFNVMSYKDEVRAEITLVSGKVEVLKDNEFKRILPGQQACITKNIKGIVVNNVDTRLHTAWREGIFYFDNINLYDLTKKLSRWYSVEFFFDNNDLKDLRFSGAVTKYRSIDYLLDLIEKTNNIDFRIKNKAIWISYKK